MYRAIRSWSPGWWESPWEFGASCGGWRSGIEGQMGLKADLCDQVLSVAGSRDRWNVAWNTSALGPWSPLMEEWRPEEGHISCQLQRISMRCCYFRFSNLIFFLFRFCKKPLTSNCTIQIVTPGKGKKSTPKPIPILAAGFCSDKMSLLLVYGNWFQPTIERVVCRRCSAVNSMVSTCLWEEGFKMMRWSAFVEYFKRVTYVPWRTFFTGWFSLVYENSMYNLLTPVYPKYFNA